MKNTQIGDLFFTFAEDYGNTIYQCVNNNLQCDCGQNDQCLLQIVCNNNFGWNETDGQFFPYNENKGKYLYECEKNLLKDIRLNKIRKFNKKQAVALKEKLIKNEDN